MGRAALREPRSRVASLDGVVCISTSTTGLNHALASSTLHFKLRSQIDPAMEDDYYSIESILAENQKLQCTFKVDVPDMGHLDGGKTGDVRLHAMVALTVI